MTPRCRTYAFGALLLPLLFAYGCKKHEVSVYDVPKQEAGSASRPGQSPSSTAGRLDWTKPEHWESLAPTAFRKGNYLYASDGSDPVEITVSSFPGQAGGLLANVNRWLEQAGQEPIGQADLIELVERKVISGNVCLIVDLKDKDQPETATRIYAAVLDYAGQSWFFKMTGPSAALQTQILPFHKMLDSLTFIADGGADAAPVSAAQSPSQLIFDSPSGWVESAGSSLRVASFSVPGDGGPPADFAITNFPGDTGGLVANVNRWRGQIGLAAWDAETVRSNVETIRNPSGVDFQILDLRPETPEQRQRTRDRILVAIAENQGYTWFFKLQGAETLIESQIGRFRSLLQSVRFQESEPVAR